MILIHYSKVLAGNIMDGMRWGFLGSLILIIPSWLAAAPMSLREAYDSALSKNTQLPLQKAIEGQADEKISQATGGILPSISFLGSYTRQAAPSSLSSISNANPAAFRPEATTLRFNATQPLFRGLREFAELRRTKANHRAEEATTKQVRLTLYSQVAGAYYSVLSNERELVSLERIHKLTQERVDDLQGRVKIGRSRRGELLSAKAQAMNLHASIQSTEAAKNAARETFQLVTGLARETELAPQDTTPLPDLRNLDSYLGYLEVRPDIQANKELVAAAEAVSSGAWGAHLPSLDLSGNYYLQRPGILNDIKWDVGLTLTVPIFQGGVVNSQVREAAENRKAAELALAETRRTAERDIRSFYEQIRGAKAQYASLTEAVSLAKENYREQSKDYKFGLVQNQDVIEALNTLLDSERLMERTRFQILSLHASLLAATGELPEK